MKSSNENLPFGITVRLDRKLVDDVKKLKKDERLPTIGAALKFWIEQQITERRELELADLRKTVENTRKDVKKLANNVGKIIQRQEKRINALARQTSGGTEEPIQP